MTEHKEKLFLTALLAIITIAAYSQTAEEKKLAYEYGVNDDFDSFSEILNRYDDSSEEWSNLMEIFGEGNKPHKEKTTSSPNSSKIF